MTNSCWHQKQSENDPKWRLVGRSPNFRVAKIDPKSRFLGRINREQMVQKSMSGEKFRSIASRVEKRPLEPRPGALLLEAKLAPSWARWRPRWASKRQIIAHSWSLKIDVDLDFTWNRIFSKFGWLEVFRMKAFGGQKSQYLRTMLEMREELRTIIFLLYYQ